MLMLQDERLLMKTVEDVLQVRPDRKGTGVRRLKCGKNEHNAGVAIRCMYSDDINS